MQKMKSNQAGFTLIELVVVIVILGILAATALPKFVNLSDDAEKAAIKGVAGGLASAASINYAGCAATNNVATPNKCVKVSKCSDVGSLLNPPLSLAVGTAADKYYLSTADTGVTTNGAAVECTLLKGSYTATYSAIGAANTVDP